MNKSDGSPYDRGSADSYYRRRQTPNKMIGNYIIWLKPGTPEWDEYLAGYRDNEALQNWKDWE
jgi:hypothetical protein